MKDYKQLIKENKGEFEDAEQLEDFISNYTVGGLEVDITGLEDDLTEYADGLVPIYYADIVKEWQDRNGDARGLAHDQGMDEGSEGDAYKLMSMDLYCLYEQELREDYNKLIELMDEQDDEAEATIEDLKN